MRSGLAPCPSRKRHTIIYSAFLMMSLVPVTSGADCTFPGFPEAATRWRVASGDASSTSYPSYVFTDGRVTVDFSPQDDLDDTPRVAFMCEFVLGDSGQVLVSARLGDGSVRFMCVHFIERSPFIIQMKTSEESATPDAYLCNDFSLILKPYIFLRDSGFNGTDYPQTCSFSFEGGYVVSQWYAEDNVARCNSPTMNSPLTILEGQCSAGEELVFIGEGDIDCPSPDVDPGGLKYFRCLASWEDQSYVYTVVVSGSGRTSCFRYPRIRSAEFTVHMFLDSVCDMTADISSSLVYRTLNLQLHPIYICTQDAPLCRSSRPSVCALDAMRRTCKRTCKSCNPETPFLARRKLPNFLLGNWLRVRDVRTQEVIIITSESLQFYPRVGAPSQGTILAFVDVIHCDGRSNVRSPRADELYMFLSVPDNGCAPKIYLVRASAVTQSLLSMNILETPWSLRHAEVYYYISKLFRWEVEPELVCSLPRPDVHEPFARAADDESAYYVIDWTNSPRNLNFSFPPSKRFHQVSFPERNINCTAFINTTDNGAAFVETFLSCENKNDTRETPWTYIPDVLLPGQNGTFLITKTPQTVTSVYLCWWLPDDESEGYILEMNQCKDEVVTEVKAGRHVPIARLVFLKDMSRQTATSGGATRCVPLILLTSWFLCVLSQTNLLRDLIECC